MEGHLGQIIRNELKQFALKPFPSCPSCSSAQTNNAQFRLAPPKMQSADRPLESDELPPGPEDLQLSRNSCPSYTSSHDVTSDLKEPLLSAKTRTDGAARSMRAFKSMSTIQQSHMDHQQEIQRMVKEALQEYTYDVEELYSDSGIWQEMARQGSFFSILTNIMILINVVWIGIDTDYNTASILIQAPVMFQLVDNTFCAYFVFEIIVRLLAFRDRLDALRDPSFLCDAFLVLVMVWETWIEVILYLMFDYTASGNSPMCIMRVFRLFRLLRVGRIIRLLHQLPELMILVKGMGKAMRSVAAVLSLLAIIVYVFSVLFTQLLRDTELGRGSFEGVLQSMNFLLVQVLTGFDATYMARLCAENLACYLLFLAFLFLTSLAMMNMLVGILCDVISKVSEEESEQSALEKLHNEITVIAGELDEDDSGCLCRAEFEVLMRRPEALRCLDNLGVDLVGFVDYVHFVFPADDELALKDFCHMIGQFRGSNVATVKDIVDMRKYISRELVSLEARLFGARGDKAR
eukprot:TRINITY_DN12301_c0_g4_i1.p1 TRINITY_DN12301_c0_g4~~TRINITY_DN12301_c0_g4_i1.p1  ORF type:complete len:581 (-),score=86.36 TRINITY_DN12301_c0_g4_i1:72-1628(-)